MNLEFNLNLPICRCQRYAGEDPARLGWAVGGQADVATHKLLLLANICSFVCTAAATASGLPQRTGLSG